MREDKEREASQGYDGTWVAHPDLVPVALEIFDRVLGDRPNQLDVLRDDVHTAPPSCSTSPRTPGEITEAGLRNDVSVGIQYLAAWLQRLGRGRDLQPDGGRRDLGDLTLAGLAVAASRQGLARRRRAGHRRGGREARRRLRRGAPSCSTRSATGDEFVEFLTLPAYERLAEPQGVASA